MNFQATSGAAALKQYRADHPRGLTRLGLATIVERAMFGGLFGGLRLAKPDLNEPVGHAGLNWVQR